MLPAFRLAALSGWASYRWVAALLGRLSTLAGIDVQFGKAQLKEIRSRRARFVVVLARVQWIKFEDSLMIFRVSYVHSANEINSNAVVLSQQTVG